MVEGAYAVAHVHTSEAPGLHQFALLHTPVIVIGSVLAFTGQLLVLEGLQGTEE
jgi:hypothetical protein